MSDRTAPLAPIASPGADTPDRAPIRLLRLEGLALLTAALVAYGWLHRTVPGTPGWGIFALLFLLPDLSMIAYLRSPVAGATLYNLAHTETVPLVLAGLSVWFQVPTVTAGALIWLAHIGFDRMAGYGLKYASAFGHTHLGPIGRAR